MKHIFKSDFLKNSLKKNAHGGYPENLLPLVSNLVPDWASLHMEESTLNFMQRSEKHLCPMVMADILFSKKLLNALLNGFEAYDEL